MTMQRLALATIGVLATACWSPTEPVDSTLHPELPENRGPVVAQLGHPSATSRLAWSADGSSVYLHAYKGTGPWTYPIREVQVATGTVREVTVLASQPYEILPLSATAVAYTLLSSQTNFPALHEVAGDGSAPTVIDPALDWGIGGSFEVRRVALAANGELVFLRRPATLVVRSAAGETRVLSDNCRSIVALSPARDRVLCVSGVMGTFATVSIADGAVAPVSLPGNVGPVVLAVHWGQADIQFLYHDFLELRTASSTSSATRNVYLGDGDTNLSSGIDMPVSWSPDGTTIAFWRWECIRDTGFLACETQRRLMLVDVATLATRHVAVVRDPSDFSVQPSVPVFSPDGSRLVYHLRGVVHMVGTAP